MAALESGVLMKLVEEMGSSQKASNDRKPMLLQIRTIIPVLSEGDLWPSKGFYLKVSDSTHSMFASLPQEKDEMVLGDQLQLGQLIFVERLEVGHPVPVLEGIRPVPGRFPCVGKPEELFSIDKLLDSRGASEVVSVMEKKFQGRFRCLCASKARESEKKRACRDGNCDVVVRKGFRKMKSSFVEKDSGSDNTLSSSSSALTAKTRNWVGAEQVVDCPQVVKHQMKPNVRRSCTACASLVHSTKCVSSDDRSNPTTRKISDDLAKSSTEYSKSRTSLPTETCEQSLDPHANRPDRKIPWNSLPPTLSKLGKEVLRQRDAAVLAAVETLQKASAADRLLQCLSTYSELQSAQREEHQPSVNKYFNFEDDLARTRLIIQSLTSISPLKNNDRSALCSPTIKEASVLALDRKKKATSWIKLALAADLTAPAGVSVESTNPSHTSSKTNGGGKPKGACIVNLKNQNDVHFRLAMEKENSQNWVKGNVSSAAAKLESSLHDECRRWFLGSFESYLDEIQRNTVVMEWNNQVAETMCQIKKVGEWLQGIANKDESELAAYGRIKNKIYGVLLKHVETTAMALQHMNAVIEDRQQ